jgi:hypothetical protein
VACDGRTASARDSGGPGSPLLATPFAVPGHAATSSASFEMSIPTKTSPITTFPGGAPYTGPALLMRARRPRQLFGLWKGKTGRPSYPTASWARIRRSAPPQLRTPMLGLEHGRQDTRHSATSTPATPGAAVSNSQAILPSTRRGLGQRRDPQGFGWQLASCFCVAAMSWAGSRDRYASPVDAPCLERQMAQWAAVLVQSPCPGEVSGARGRRQTYWVVQPLPVISFPAAT